MCRVLGDDVAEGIALDRDFLARRHLVVQVADKHFAECPDFRMNAVLLSGRWSRIRHRVWSLNGDVAGREPVDADAGTDNRKLGSVELLLKSPARTRPGGTYDSSPAIYRRVRDHLGLRPGGTPEDHRAINPKGLGTCTLSAQG
jgi:hypothetical protein